MQGDVQMCATVLIVLGDKIKSQIDEVAQEQWFMSYIGTGLYFEFQQITLQNGGVRKKISSVIIFAP